MLLVGKVVLTGKNKKIGTNGKEGVLFVGKVVLSRQFGGDVIAYCTSRAFF